MAAGASGVHGGVSSQILSEAQRRSAETCQRNVSEETSEKGEEGRCAASKAGWLRLSRLRTLLTAGLHSGVMVMTNEERRARQREYNCKYRQEHPEKCREYSRNYYYRNRERCLEQQKKYQQEHREQYLKYQRQWRREHREEHLEYQRKYCEKKRLKKRE